ncbi:cell wall-binding repeat-containing protein [Phycicoccus flavus]|uniref:Cell wall-binding repeat-containing protein n=1 Tax=Phycicoccus flavus TaxID=2502783 RepID=A0A8T6R118_9MICO|nr:cell wall-binding repeat-containing protein [Phycicoccus flavus]NHA68008.1 hypothetical protein [Phycicoccus flavus]
MADAAARARGPVDRPHRRSARARLAVVAALVAVLGAVTATADARGPAAAPVTRTSLAGADAPGVFRLAGADRYAASAAVSAATFDPGVPVAYVATGLNFPDALAGGPVGGYTGGPVLLVRTDSVPVVVAAELRRLAPRRIVVLGGTTSVTDGVKQSLGAFTTGLVTRLDGANRYEAAARISAETFAPGVPVVHVATGRNFPDALSGGPPAALAGGPVLLVGTGTIPRATARELVRLAPRRIVVLGGTTSVSGAVEADLARYTSGSVERLDGANRYVASARVSAASFGAGSRVAYVATGENFPDALSGGPAGGVDGAPMLLVRGTAIPDATAAELTRLRPERIVVLGGPASVSADVQAALEQYVVPRGPLSVRGTVTEQGGSGAPLSGVGLRVYDDALGELTSLATVSDANGVYRVVGAPAGRVRLCVDGSTATGGSVDPSGYEAECHRDRAGPSTADPVTVGATPVTGLDVGLRGLGAATVTTTDTAGTPLPGVAVYVYGPRGLRRDLVTDSLGRTPTGALPAGSFLVCYDAWGVTVGRGASYGYDPYSACTDAGAALAPTLSVTAGTTTRRTVPVTASATVQGRVTSTAGARVQGATVRVVNEMVPGDGIEAVGVTDAEGYYQVSGVRGNTTHRVCVDPPAGFVARCVDGGTTPEAQPRTVDVVLSPGS